MARKKRDSDFAVTAFRVVDQVIKNTETIEIETVQIEGKNPHAVALGKLGGSKGGKIRAERLTPEQRTGIAQKAARKRWEKK
jgi:isopropylmalate/homocitrate/citramalate synthase